jgi:hypothetical protein
MEFWMLFPKWKRLNKKEIQFSSNEIGLLNLFFLYRQRVHSHREALVPKTCHLDIEGLDLLVPLVFVGMMDEK